MIGSYAENQFPPTIGHDHRQQPLPLGDRQNLGLLHPENLIQSGYSSESIIFSGLPEVDRKVKPPKPSSPANSASPERLLAFETMGAAWPEGRTAIERAEIGREREEALYEIAALRQPCCPHPTRVGWSPRCWRWSSGRLRRRHLSTDVAGSHREYGILESHRARSCYP